MPDYKGMDKSQYSGNDRYMKMMKGGKSNMKLMKNHGNTYPISANAQKFDMGRLNASKMEYKGYPDKAFDYKY
jgi:hypothetical protein